MKVLVLNPENRFTQYSLVTGGKESGLAGTAGAVYSPGDALDVMGKIKNKIAGGTENHSSHSSAQIIDALAIRVIYGGQAFTKPPVWSDLVDRKLTAITPFSPLHIPRVKMLAGACKRVFPGIPAVLVFETSLSASLPPWESFYAIDPVMASGNQIRRFGFHGIQHEGAAQYASACLGGKRKNLPLRIFSVCLEPKPEAAAISGLRQVMTTSGATPLEGLIGETSCGDTDAGILIRMAQDLHMGPEQINFTLTGESGLYALTGKRVRLDEIFINPERHFKRARQVFLYRLLLAAGGAAAALGNIDCIVFSGRYRHCGTFIGNWLLKKLKFLHRDRDGQAILCLILPGSLEELIAARAAVPVIEERNRKKAQAVV